MAYILGVYEKHRGVSLLRSGDVEPKRMDS